MIPAETTLVEPVAGADVFGKRHGLELAASEANEKLRALRGKVSFSLDLKKLREDRR